MPFNDYYLSFNCCMGFETRHFMGFDLTMRLAVLVNVNTKLPRFCYKIIHNMFSSPKYLLTSFVSVSSRFAFVFSLHRAPPTCQPLRIKIALPYLSPPHSLLRRLLASLNSQGTPVIGRGLIKRAPSVGSAPLISRQGCVEQLR